MFSTEPFQILSPSYSHFALYGDLDIVEGCQVQKRDDMSYFYLWLKNSDSKDLLDFTLTGYKMICACSANREYSISANS